MTAITDFGGTTEDRFLMGNVAGERTGVASPASDRTASRNEGNKNVVHEALGVALKNDINYPEAQPVRLMGNSETGFDIIFANAPEPNKTLNFVLDPSGQVFFREEAAGKQGEVVVVETGGKDVDTTSTVYSANYTSVINWVYVRFRNIPAGTAINLIRDGNSTSQLFNLTEADTVYNNGAYFRPADPVLNFEDILSVQLNTTSPTDVMVVVSISPVKKTVNMAT